MRSGSRQLERAGSGIPSTMQLSGWPFQNISSTSLGCHATRLVSTTQLSGIRVAQSATAHLEREFSEHQNKPIHST